MSKRISLITGITGQDGTLCSRALLERGDLVLGLSLKANRPLTRSANCYIKATSIDNYLASFTQLVREYKPQSVYNFAAISSSLRVNEVSSHITYSNLFLPLALIESYFSLMPEGRFFQASSSYVFPYSSISITENSVKYPDSIYGTMKDIVDKSCASYRDLGCFVVNAYLFSHESYLRPSDSLSIRLLNSIQSATPDNPLILDQWNKLNDWSDADSVIDFALKSLEHNIPSDYVVGSGQVVTVYNYACSIARLLGKEPSKVLIKGSHSDHNRFRLSNPIKSQTLLNWKPTENIDIVASKIIRH